MPEIKEIMNTSIIIQVDIAKLEALKETMKNDITNYEKWLNDKDKLRIMTKKEEKFKILVDQKPFEVEEQFITGTQIKALVGAPANYGVWLKVNGPNPDKEIADNEQDGKVLIERVQDSYFEQGNWEVLLKKGESWYQCDNHNKLTNKISEEDMKLFMDQYHPAETACKFDDDDKNLYIRLHY